MTPLWQPTEDAIDAAAMTGFLQQVADTQGVDLQGYAGLHRWSVEHPAEFWSQIWDFCHVQGEKGKAPYLVDPRMPGARFFPGARLNFAENLLHFQDERTALVSRLENGERRTLTYAELAARSGALAAHLRDLGVDQGDRVAAFLPNVMEAVIGMLATASIGAIWSSCSPDFGASGVFDRFGQIQPKVLIACNGYFYNGKKIDTRDVVQTVCRQVDSITDVLVVNVVGATHMDLDERTAQHDFAALCSRAPASPAYERLPFSHPLYIMYSSGTTGAPKCIVHGAGGTLLQHLKEHQLHVNLHRDDVLFYFTTCGWMMWNWLVSGLATGATLVLYDGSPFYPGPNAMMDMIDEEQITIFGTSAKYLSALQKADVKPVESHSLASVHTILSTGSPLSNESFKYVYRDMKQSVCLSSISGGTDIVSCFALGTPTLPVYEGELQCAGLGMDVAFYNDAGKAVSGEKGELVCRTPFPSMPVGFWDDPNDTKFRAAYFDRFPGIWAHGDYGEITERNGIIIHGRSDAVLNPGGVRIGTAEIYRQVEKIHSVADCLCIGQDTGDDDVRVVLFVVLQTGVTLDDNLKDEIRRTIRKDTTPRHVPAIIIQVTDIPRTISGKIVELAVRNVVHGQPVTNTDALANPEALAYFENLPELTL